MGRPQRRSWARRVSGSRPQALMGFPQVVEAAGAHGHEGAVGRSQGQVPHRQGEGDLLIQDVGGRRAAAIPVLQFDEVEAQDPGGLYQGDVALPGRTFQGTAGKIRQVRQIEAAVAHNYLFQCGMNRRVISSMALTREALRSILRLANILRPTSRSANHWWTRAL